MAYISRYSPRPGTAAYKLEDDVTKEEKKEREEILMKILKKTALQHNNKYLNKDVEVLVGGRNKKGEIFGHTRTYKSVRINKGKKNLVGTVVTVKIKNIKDFRLEGELNN